jgi:diacylglycerol kinase (ATP)
MPESNGAPPRFSVIGRLKSFGYAFAGLGFMLQTQHNAWLHLVATFFVLVLAWCFKVTPDDWRWLIAAILMVWSAEAFNTAVEYVCDVVSPGYSLVVKNAKDIAAGAVLISAFCALIIGIITFWPYVHAALAAPG